MDRLPTPENALRVTAQTHDALILLLGSTVIAAVRLFDRFPGWTIPVPDVVGLVLIPHIPNRSGPGKNKINPPR